jgi:hypothetical protein
VILPPSVAAGAGAASAAPQSESPPARASTVSLPARGVNAGTEAGGAGGDRAEPTGRRQRGRSEAKRPAPVPAWDDDESAALSAARRAGADEEDDEGYGSTDDDEESLTEEEYEPPREADALDAEVRAHQFCGVLPEFTMRPRQSRSLGCSCCIQVLRLSGCALLQVLASLKATRVVCMSTRTDVSPRFVKLEPLLACAACNAA